MVSRFWALAPACALALGACDAILAIPERALDPHVTCDDGSCVCSGDYDSCDGSDDNGCETNLSFDPTNCGRCGHDCIDTLCKQSLCASGLVVGNETNTISDIALEGGLIYYTTLFGDPIREFAIQEVRSRYVPGSDGASWLRLRDQVAYAMSTDEARAVPLDGDAQPRSLASGMNANGKMAVGGGWLYWMAGPIRKMGGEPSTIYQLFGVPVDGSAAPVEIYESSPNVQASDVAADAGRVYWADEQGIFSAPHGASAGEAARIASVDALPIRLLVDERAVYWIDRSGVFKAPISGGAPEILARGPEDSETLQLAIDEEHAFFALQPHDMSMFELRKVPLGGGDVIVVAKTPQLDREKQILTDASYVYWIANNSVRRVAK